MNNDAAPLKDVIMEFLKLFRVEERFDQLKLIEEWEKVAGTVIARHTTSIFLKNRQLQITLDSAALKNNLIYSKSKLINSLNKALKKNIIEDIVFR